MLNVSKQAKSGTLPCIFKKIHQQVVIFSSDILHITPVTTLGTRYKNLSRKALAATENRRIFSWNFRAALRTASTDALPSAAPFSTPRVFYFPPAPLPLAHTFQRVRSPSGSSRRCNNTRPPLTSCPLSSVSPLNFFLSFFCFVSFPSWRFPHLLMLSFCEVKHARPHHLLFPSTTFPQVPPTLPIPRGLRAPSHRRARLSRGRLPGARQQAGLTGLYRLPSATPATGPGCSEPHADPSPGWGPACGPRYQEGGRASRGSCPQLRGPNPAGGPGCPEPSRGSGVPRMRGDNTRPRWARAQR